MIRITYQDREYTLQPDDNGSRPVQFAPRDNASWVTVLDQAGLKFELLVGGTKPAPRVDAQPEETDRD